MDFILDGILDVEPQYILLREVVEPMRATAKRRLQRWMIHRRKEQLEDYLLVSAVKMPTAFDHKCKPCAVPTSHNGRHIITVRQGPWATVNVHAESGGLARQSRERGAQLLHMSRLHKCDEDRAYVIAVDFNVRAGGDHCSLLRTGSTHGTHAAKQPMSRIGLGARAGIQPVTTAFTCGRTASASQ